MQSSDQQRLTAIYGVEPGCLGPEGDSHVADFCLFADAEVAAIGSVYIQWQFIPRIDKCQPEIIYKIGEKRLTHSQASRYVALYQFNIDALEDEIHAIIESLIDRYCGR